MCTWQVYSMSLILKYILSVWLEVFYSHTFIFILKNSNKTPCLVNCDGLTQSELFSWKQRRVETIVQHGSQQNV